MQGTEAQPTAFDITPGPRTAGRLPRQVWGYAGAVTVALLLHAAVMSDPRDGDPTTHAFVAALAVAAALSVAALALLRHLDRHEPILLVIGIAFGIAGLADIPHALTAAAGSGAGSWLLPGLVLLGLLVLVRPERTPGTRRSAGGALFVAASAATLLGLYVMSRSGPDVGPGAVVARPSELLAAPLHLLALLAYWHAGRSPRRHLDPWLELSLVLGLLVQLTLIPFSHSPFDGFALAARGLELAGTLGVLAALLHGLHVHARTELEVVQALRDEIEERKRLERALARQAALLSRSNEELEEFAYVASHDLQEPLRMVSSYLQLLERRYGAVFDDDGREFLHFAVDGAIRMKALINDLLLYSRVTTQARDFEVIDAGASFREALLNLTVAIEESAAEIACDPLPLVRADPHQLTQLFQNLLGNAIKFRRSDEPLRIHVSAEEAEGNWHFSVTDNGIGMKPRYAERIFGIFTRLHTSDAYPGSGIGLAVCRKIVERHQGRIWVTSEVGRGATFSFTLPSANATPPPGAEGAGIADTDPIEIAVERHATSLIERAKELV